MMFDGIELFSILFLCLTYLVITFGISCLIITSKIYKVLFFVFTALLVLLTLITALIINIYDIITSNIALKVLFIIVSINILITISSLFIKEKFKHNRL